MKDNDLQPNHPGQPEDDQGQAQEKENNQQDQGGLPHEEERIDSTYPESDELYKEENEHPAVMHSGDQPHYDEQPPADGGGNGSKGWMIASLVLAAALIVVLIVPPFAKGSGNEAIAKVNDVNITKDNLYDELVSVGGKQTLNSMITEELIQQELKNKSITVTDADVNKEVDALKASFPSEEQFNMALQQNGMTLDNLKEQTKTQVELKKLMADKIKVTDEEVKEVYDQNKASFATPEQVRASHILVETKEEAEAIVKQLKEGADFATIAKEKNQDATKDTGGDLNFFGRGEMDPTFEEAAFKLKKDEISEPVKSSFGYHIIKVTDRKEATNPTLEEKKDEIRSQLENQKVYAESPAYIQELKDKATITNTLEEAPAEAPTEAPAEAPADTTETP
ncbi:peptidyl-prolyl cis-trans isomerase [Paenibacillus lautus]|uniref:peptidyl-prolyl cis-trans isomerase n=1 Tax=Paenibacillus lautus TaxID=1401 RepID=UPI002FBE4FBF